MSKNENENESEKAIPFLAPENMAFVHCPECYGEMAADAIVCPHCGATPDGDVKQKSKTAYYLVVLLIGLGAAVILAGLFLDFAGPAMIVGGVLLLAASLIKRFV